MWEHHHPRWARLTDGAARTPPLTTQAPDLMSISVNPIPTPSEEAPMLPEAIRTHLGRMLGLAYAEVPEGEGQSSERFAGLLSRLERALVVQGDCDERAFRAEFLAMLPRLHNFAMSLARNPALADDLVQDTMLRAWRSRSRFVAGTNLGAWLFTIMRNAFYSLHRKDAREVGDTDGDLAERVATVPEQSGHIDLQDAQTALEKLPPLMRQALILVAIENLSYEEAAEVMACRIGTVKSRVWRAREQLARLLGYETAEIGADAMTLSALGVGTMQRV